MTKSTQYKPVAFNPNSYASKRRKSDAQFAVAYDKLEDEFSALSALLAARTSAGLTQAEVAARMGVSQPVLRELNPAWGKKSTPPHLAPFAATLTHAV